MLLRFQFRRHIVPSENTPRAACLYRECVEVLNPGRIVVMSSTGDPKPLQTHFQLIDKE